MVQCDVEVPDRLRASFAEMLPVFKNAETLPSNVGHRRLHPAVRRSQPHDKHGEDVSRVVERRPLVLRYHPVTPAGNS
ncbi:hypothetical protein ACOMHN_032614 [Nucella lapillus]